MNKHLQNLCSGVSFPVYPAIQNSAKNQLSKFMKNKHLDVKG